MPDKLEVTEKDRIEYIKTQVQRILAMPFNYILHADAKFYAGQLEGEDRHQAFIEIKEWFNNG